MPMSPWTPDRTLSMVRNPYRFVADRAHDLGADVFETRLLLRRTICMTGPEAAAVFYDPRRFQRTGAAPGRLEKTLFGRGGVQGLEGDQHRHRKQIFLDAVSPQRVDALADAMRRHWQTYARRWSAMSQVDLYPQAQEILTRAVCEWSGLPLSEHEVHERTRQFTALFDDAGAVGPRHWRSRIARKNADRWARKVIESIRAGDLQPPQESAAHLIARHTASDGTLLPTRVAAVELLNILRPTVAVSVYITFVAHALAANPDWRERLANGDGSEDVPFVQEVRRYYPFFPAVAAVVREDFDWGGHHFVKGRRTLLDLYGINRDRRAWDRPDLFDPSRFVDWDGDPYRFVPQGGGDPTTHHRCPGEPISVALMVVAVDELTRRHPFEVAGEPHPIDDKRLPALPRGGLAIGPISG